jgi:CBS domain-containing protein
MKTCGDVMTSNPRYCSPRDTVEHVANMMKSENVGLIPVVENSESKRVIGVVTDRDLALKIVAMGLDSKTNVEIAMTRNPITCAKSHALDKALKAMSGNQIRRIPVVNDNNELVGIIAQADIATRMDEPKKTAEVVEEISKPN